MRTGLVSLAVVASAAALPSPPTLNGRVNGVSSALVTVFDEICQALPLDAYIGEFQHHLVPLEEAKVRLANYKITSPPKADPAPSSSYHPYKVAAYQSGAKCANLQTRVEWDRMADSDRQKFFDGIKCLLNKAPSGQFPNAKNRYEDLIALHQKLTPNVHLNDKFLPWHRAFVHLLHRILRNECGFDGPLPWFDETRYAGRFASSSLFSSQWLGGLAINGNCVRDGQFANLVLNVGPGNSNTVHCLARNGDGSQTKYCNQEFVDLCNRYPDYAGLRSCIEIGYHGYGHNGIGAVMSDVQCSVGDIFFWLHHAFVDRCYRLWTNANPQWLTQINGNDINGNPLTLDTVISTYGMMPDLRIRDILDTTGPTLCYKYDY